MMNEYNPILVIAFPRFHIPGLPVPPGLSPCNADPGASAGSKKGLGLDHFVNCWTLHNLSIILILFSAVCGCSQEFHLSLAYVDMPDIRRIATIGQLPDKMLEGISKPPSLPHCHAADYYVARGRGACWGF